ncbi:MAG: DUF4886 domain-containing protein [Verrucomicrobiales bacterium]|jgi:hypothetical protein
MPTKSTFLILLLALTPLIAQTTAKTPTPPQPKKILFIGNSYTGGIRKTVTELIKSSPHADTQLTFINPGGKTLAFHLTNQATTEKIKTGNFDIVVLQDQSQTPALFPDRFQKAALGLDKIIDASGAQTVFYQTWGRRDGTKNFPTYEAMQRALSQSYATTAKACQATLAPVGDTWSSLRKKNPKLGQELYAKDGSHPSGKGAYLAACVFYQTFFKGDPKTLTFTANLPAPEAQLIRELSSTTIKK